jgi:hypothetical protein
MRSDAAATRISAEDAGWTKAKKAMIKLDIKTLSFDNGDGLMNLEDFDE